MARNSLTVKVMLVGCVMLYCWNSDGSMARFVRSLPLGSRPPSTSMSFEIWNDSGGVNASLQQRVAHPAQQRS